MSWRAPKIASPSSAATTTRLVQDYNTYIALFPNSLVASMAGFRATNADFKTDAGARQAPKVDFDYDKKPASATPAPTPTPTPAPVHP